MKRSMVVLTLGSAFAFLGILASLQLHSSPAPDIGLASPDADLTCSVKAACESAEVEVFRMSSTSNAHAGTPSGSGYGYSVCCGEVSGLGTECTGNYAAVLRLSAADNAHVAETDVGYETEVCLSGGDDATVDCTYGATCDVDYACVATISASTNAHVADCDGVEDYATKVCCLVTSDNCPDVPNPGQENNVHPATPEGDHCEDPEPDGVVDIDDNCPDVFNPDQFESEQPPDGLGDVCDPDTQDSSAVSGPDGSVTVTTPDGAIDFDGFTADPYSTVTIQEDAAGIGTIEVTTKGKNSVRNKFDLLSTSLLTGTVTKVTDFPPPGISQQQLDNLTVSKKVTGPSQDIPYTVVGTQPGTAPYTQVTVSFGITDDATFSVLVPADTDFDGVYDQFDLNDDGDFDDADELDNCPTVANADQANTDATDQDGDTLLDEDPLDVAHNDDDGDTVADEDPPDDGAGDACDPDDDGDGYSDSDEAEKGSEVLGATSAPEHCDEADNDGDTLTDEGYDRDPANGTPDCLEYAGPDMDGDGFSDAAEQWMSTDELDDCPDASNPWDATQDDAWPPDIDGDTDADIVDVLKFKSSILTSVEDVYYSKRLDFDADGDVDIVDVLKYRPVIMTSCGP